jgi:hypothetical protein
MSTHNTSATVGEPSDATGDVNEIKASIERTQAHLANTVAELQRKLTVSHLMDETKRATREKLQDWTNSGRAAAAVAATRLQGALGEARVRVLRNPAPVVLGGAGLAAALWQGARRRARRKA